MSLSIQYRSLLPALLILAVMPATAADTAERFAQANQALRSGDNAGALTTLDLLHEEHPDDVDYSFARGQALARLDRDDEALEQFAHAIGLAPEYEDVWRARYNVLLRQQSQYGDELLEFRERAARQFPTANWWRAEAAEERHPWELVFGANIDSLSDDLPGWDAQFMELIYERDEQWLYALNVSRDARDGTGDVSTGLRANSTWASGWLAGVDLAMASSPKFVPETSASAHLSRILGNGWSTSLRMRYRDYSSATVSSVIGGVERYFADYRIAYELGSSHLHGASSFTNHVLAANWYYNDASSVGVSLSTGREAESIGGGRVLETDVSGVAVNGRHQLSERLGLQWWLGIHDQGDLYRRKFLGMALSIRL